MNNSKFTTPEGHEDRFLNKLLLQNKKLKRKKQIRYLSIAASLALLIASSFFFFDFKNEQLAKSPFPEEVQEAINFYQAKLDAEIEEIKNMACYAQLQKEVSEIQKTSFPAEELALLPVNKQLYYIEQIYTIKIEAVQYMQTVCI